MNATSPLKDARHTCDEPLSRHGFDRDDKGCPVCAEALRRWNEQRDQRSTWMEELRRRVVEHEDRAAELADNEAMSSIAHSFVARGLRTRLASQSASGRDA